MVKITIGQQDFKSSNPSTSNPNNPRRNGMGIRNALAMLLTTKVPKTNDENESGPAPSISSTSRSVYSNASTSTYSSSTTIGVGDSRRGLSEPDVAISKTSLQNSAIPPIQTVQYSLKNRRIISTNIRHFLVLFWILLFATGMLLLSYISIARKMIFLDSNLFSLSIIRPFLLPIVLISTLVSLGHIIIAHFKVEKLSSVIIHKVYLVSCCVMLLHYLVMITITGVMLYLSLTSLEKDMVKVFNKSLDEHVISKEFHITQRQRRCCGVHGHDDWPVVDDLANLFKNWTSDLSYYPSSCCPEIKENDIVFCSPENLWDTGCYTVERNWISWYCGWYIVALGVGLALNALLYCQVLRIYNYCKIYRPLWITPEKKPTEDNFKKVEDNSINWQ